VAKRNQLEIHLTGGLGNQLFQYAAGLHMANLMGSKLLLNLNRVARHDIQVSCDITSFSLDSTCSNVKSISSPRIDLLRTGVLRRAFQKPLLNKLVMAEVENSHFNAGISAGRPTKHLFGYFGDFKYYDSLRDQQKLFRLVNPSPWFSEFLQQNSRGFNALHIRLGDYTSDMNHYGVLSPNYYRRILDHLITIIKVFHFLFLLRLN
jgi:hypothetical protein